MKTFLENFGRIVEKFLKIFEKMVKEIHLFPKFGFSFSIFGALRMGALFEFLSK